MKPIIARNELRRVAIKRIAETFGKEYARSVEATDVIDAFVRSLARGCLVIVDSRSGIVYFRNDYVNSGNGKSA